MKILLTVHQFFPEHKSGTEVLTLESARALRAMGHQVRIVTGFYRHEQLRDDERFDRYEYDGFEIERFAFSPSPMGGNMNLTRLEHDNPLFAEKFRDVIDRFQPDVVHFFHLMRLSGSFVDVCRSKRIPTVLTPTDFWFVCPYAQLMLPDHGVCAGPSDDGLNCIRHFMHSNRKVSFPYAMASKVPDMLLRTGLGMVRRNLHHRLRMPGVILTLAESARAVSDRLPFLSERLSQIDRILVPNRYMWDVLARYGMNKERAVIQPYGINLAYQPEVERVASTRLRVGFIGTLAKHKGAHVLIEAARKLRDVDLEFKIYGNLADDPDYGTEIQLLARGDERIRFMGGFPNSEIGAVIAALDVLVVPSIWLENTPLVIYSAQAGRCPVIGSDVGGIGTAVIDGENGLLFPPGDVDALARAIERLAHDRALLQRLSAAARPPISIEEYCRVVVGHYRELVEVKP